MDERMTVCNMSIEGGARCGYVNPDQTTYNYLKGREYAPKGAAWDRAVAYWDSIKSDAGAKYDDVVRIKAEDIPPVVTWGITPAQSVAVDAAIPSVAREGLHIVFGASILVLVLALSLLYCALLRGAASF